MNRFGLWLVFVVAAAQGCGGDGLAPVTGVVLFTDGTPLTTGVIEFAPNDGGPTAKSSLDEEGRFTLHTGDRPGAVPATHLIAVMMLLPPDTAAAATKHSHPIRTPHARYRRFDTSGLERTVVADEPNEFLFVIEPAGGAERR